MSKSVSTHNLAHIPVPPSYLVQNEAHEKKYIDELYSLCLLPHVLHMSISMQIYLLFVHGYRVSSFHLIRNLFQLPSYRTNAKKVYLYKQYDFLFQICSFTIYFVDTLKLNKKKRVKYFSARILGERPKIQRKLYMSFLDNLQELVIMLIKVKKKFFFSEKTPYNCKSKLS